MKIVNNIIGRFFSARVFVLILILAALDFETFAQVKDSTLATLTIDGRQGVDSLELVVFENNYLDFVSLETQRTRSYKSPVSLGKCVFTIPVGREPKYFLVKRIGGGLNENILIPTNIIAAGDQLFYDQNAALQFAGKGWQKMLLFEAIPRLYAKARDIVYQRVQFISGKTVIGNLDVGKEMLKSLDSIRLVLSPAVYGMLKADIVGYSLRNVILRKTNTISALDVKAKQDLYGQLLAIQTAADSLAGRYQTARYLRGYYETNEKLKFRLANDGTDRYTRLSLINNAELKERLIVQYLIGEYKFIPNLDSLARMAIKEIKDPYYKAELRHLLEVQGVGRSAYNFELQGLNGEKVRLEDFRGKVVFIDFWFVGCGACANYYNEVLKPVKKAFSYNDKVVFISVCIEGDQQRWKKELLNYSDLSVVNLSTGAAAWSHPVITNYAIFSAPKPILIDHLGKINSVNALELGRGANGAAKLTDQIRLCLTEIVSNRP